MMGNLQDLQNMVSAWLASRMPTPEMIREQIARVRVIYPEVTDEEAEALAREFETIHGITMSIGSTLQKNIDFEPWLDSAKAKNAIDFYFWERYQKLLVTKGFSARVLASFANVTDRTLGLLENPKREGKWDRRGMVVGHVQSGKTANYTGLVCKAADAGYKVIIVIAGIHNNLRSQTQMRLDEGFTGFDSARLLSNQPDTSQVIGVGRYDSRRRPSVFTNSLRDFNKATATSVATPLENLKTPALFVIKKNSYTLKNLLEWLREHNARRGGSSISEPMLLIDDEADNASINIGSGRDEVSAINGQIRQLLEIFDRSCYIGYTATPFANIFIDPDSDDEMFGDDLFPRDFIVSLDPPDNYFGPSLVFGNDIEGAEQGQFIRHIEDNEDLLPLRHLVSHDVVALPDSLRTAVRTFIVARAIRLARGQTDKHNSMLVNASRFNNVQNRLRDQIHVLVEDIRHSIRVNGALSQKLALTDSEIAALHEVFIREYERASGLSWGSVQQKLLESIAPVNVVVVNRMSSSSLNYAEHATSGLNVIVVGGYSLSRGMTLEGLSISYLLRNSMMYDTLMQMGRWFGYRPGYEDLCRIWMPEEAEGWYAHIANSIEELRDELRRMEAVSATPKEFGLRVRSHPDRLLVTARNKMGSSRPIRISVGLANEFIETAILWRNSENLETNRRAAITLGKKIRNAGLLNSANAEDAASGKLVHQVPADLIMEFLLTFQNHPSAYLTDTEPVRGYIEDRISSELSEWDVLFPGLAERSEKSLVSDILGFRIICQRRSPGKRSTKDLLMITNKQRVASRGIEKIGLTQDEISEAEERYRNETTSLHSGRHLNFPDRIYRRLRKKPLLAVHLLAIGQEGEDLSGSSPIVAWSISFPQTSVEESNATYLVNPTWLLERYGPEDDEDEMAGDDGRND